MTVADLVTLVAGGLAESDKVHHTDAEIRSHLSAAETFLSLARAVAEKVLSFSTVSSVAFYNLQTLASNCILPLQVYLDGRFLPQSTLSMVAAEDPDWLENVDFPQKWFHLGMNYIGFSPVPGSALPVKMIYAAQPGSLATATATTVGGEWQEPLVHMAIAILLAKEGEIKSAVALLQKSVEKVGLPRDIRFAPSDTKGERAGRPIALPSTPQLG
jgi:hypothetical protein